MKKLCEVHVDYKSPSGRDRTLVVRNFVHPGILIEGECRLLNSVLTEPTFIEDAVIHAGDILSRHEAGFPTADEPEPVIKDLPQEEPIAEECPEPTVEEGQHVGVVPDEEDHDLGRPPGQWSMEESIEKLREHSRRVCNDGAETRGVISLQEAMKRAEERKVLARDRS